MAMPTLVARPCAERPGRGLDAAGPAVLGMAGAAAASWRKFLIASSGTDGSPRASYSLLTALTPVRCSNEYSSIEAWPAESTKRSRFGQIGSCRVEPEKLLPEAVGHRRQCHRRAGMPGVGRLHRVHRQGADRVDARRVEVFGTARFNLRHHRPPGKSTRFRRRSTVDPCAFCDYCTHETVGGNRHAKVSDRSVSSAKGRRRPQDRTGNIVPSRDDEGIAPNRRAVGLRPDPFCVLGVSHLDHVKTGDIIVLVLARQAARVTGTQLTLPAPAATRP